MRSSFRAILSSVRWFFLEFWAAILVPSMATVSFPNSPNRSQKLVNALNTFFSALRWHKAGFSPDPNPWNVRKVEMVWYEGVWRPVSHISSTLRPHSASSLREERIRF